MKVSEYLEKKNSMGQPEEMDSPEQPSLVWKREGDHRGRQSEDSQRLFMFAPRNHQCVDSLNVTLSLYLILTINYNMDILLNLLK